METVRMSIFSSLDIMGLIFDFCCFSGKIRLRQITKLLFSQLFVTDFFNIEMKYIMRLSDQILLQHPYVTKLDASIKNYIKVSKPITDYSISKLNLIVLDCSGNFQITDRGLKHLTKLKVLITRNTVLTNKSLKKINPRVLIINKTPGVTFPGLKHMSNLQVLDISDFTKFYNNPNNSNSGPINDPWQTHSNFKIIWKKNNPDYFSNLFPNLKILFGEVIYSVWFPHQELNDIKNQIDYQTDSIASMNEFQNTKKTLLSHILYNY